MDGRRCEHEWFRCGASLYFLVLLCIEVFFLSHIHGYGGGHIEVSIFFSCQNYVTASSVYFGIYEHKGHGTI